MEERHYIAFNIKNYDSELNLMVEVGNVLAAFARNDYQCLFYYEDSGIYILEYANKPHTYGGPSYMLVSEDEMEMVEDKRYGNGCDSCGISTDSPTASH